MRGLQSTSHVLASLPSISRSSAMHAGGLGQAWPSCKSFHSLSFLGVSQHVWTSVQARLHLPTTTTRFYTSTSTSSPSPSPSLSSSASESQDTTQDVSKARVIGIIAHIDAGKTTTTERMLFYSNKTHFLGNVDDGNTVTDYLRQERLRGITIQSAAVTLEWKKNNITIVDTPGHVDFTIEVERTLRVMDGCVAVVDAVAGVQAQTETVWRQANNYNLPRIAFMNKMDREGADLFSAVESLRTKLNANPVLLQLPIMDKSKRLIRGLVDLVGKKVIFYEDESQDKYGEHPCVYWMDDEKHVLRKIKGGLEISKKEMPMSALLSQEQVDQIDEYRKTMIEQVADYDDPLMDIYLDTDLDMKELDIAHAIRRATMNNHIVPVLCGSALKNRGVQSLLDAVVLYLPNPTERPPITGKTWEKRSITRRISPDEDMTAFAFKVTHDEHRGPLVFTRIFSGTLPSKLGLYNVTMDCKEVPHGLFQIMADDIKELKEAPCGSIVAISGLKKTLSGSTLCLRADKNPIMLDGFRIPPAVFSASLNCDSESTQKELENRVLDVLQREDPSLEVEHDKDTGEIVLHGMGELHLEIVLDRIVQDFKLNVTMSKPRVAYKEAITKETEEKVSIDQLSGGTRLFASLTLQVSPLDPGEDNIVDLKDLERSSDPLAIKLQTLRRKRENPLSATLDAENATSSISEDKVNAIREGLLTGLERGPLGGYGMRGVKVQVIAPKDSIQLKEIAEASVASLTACAVLGLGQVLKKSDPRLLEPVMKVQVTVPHNHLGPVVSDLSSSKRRGTIEEVGVTGEEAASAGTTATASANSMPQHSTVTAVVPLATLVGYSSTLRSVTKGTGSFSMEFAKYDFPSVAAEVEILSHK